MSMKQRGAYIFTTGVVVALFAWVTRSGSPSHVHADQVIPREPSDVSESIKPMDVQASLTPAAIAREQEHLGSSVADHDPDYTNPIYKASIIAGTVTREMYGEGYREVLKAIAEEHLLGRVEEEVEGLASTLCGFDSSVHLDAKLDRLDREAPTLAVELRSIAQEAELIANQMPSYFLNAWDRGIGLELRDPETGEIDGTGQASLPVEGEMRGLFQQSRSVHVGDRQFYFSFNSAEHPQLELQLKELHRRGKLLDNALEDL